MREKQTITFTDEVYKMETLTLRQQLVLNDIHLAPSFNKEPKADTFKFHGLVFGNWNRNTLKALERKGLVDVVGESRVDNTVFLVVN
jgi:hypothetical protein